MIGPLPVSYLMWIRYQGVFEKLREGKALGSADFIDTLEKLMGGRLNKRKLAWDW